jgi:hypothetical protein
MATKRRPLQNFNLETMSGIYPGSRTMIYQRVRIQSSGDDEPRWYQLQWYTEPPSALLSPVDAGNDNGATIIDVPSPRHPDFLPLLHATLARHAHKASACYACRHWQRRNLHSEDGLPAGRCQWQDPDAQTPDILATQSALSLACTHFQTSDTPHLDPPENGEIPASQPRMVKSAELDPDRLPFWPRLRHRLQHLLRQRKVVRPELAEQVIERSGVGAGTEPCFVCQGRIANLGALVVASPEGDKQTLSIWRCRSCYTTYFNDWTDRWERLDNLETEEKYYRIAPAEAFIALGIIHTTAGGEHPLRRAERQPQREALLALVTDKVPLSHQIRQGR